MKNLSLKCEGLLLPDLKFYNLTWSDVWTVERLRDRVQSGLDPDKGWQHGAGGGLAVRDVRNLQLVI